MPKTSTRKKPAAAPLLGGWMPAEWWGKNPPKNTPCAEQPAPRDRHRPPPYRERRLQQLARVLKARFELELEAKKIKQELVDDLRQGYMSVQDDGLIVWALDKGMIGSYAYTLPVIENWPEEDDDDED